MRIKQKLNEIKNKKINYKNKIFINIILYIIIIIIYLPFCLSKENQNLIKKLNFENEITIKMKASGEQFIVYQWGPTTPNQIYVDGELQNSSGKKVNFGEDEVEKIITLKWNSPISNCGNLFFFLSNILEIDLSKFDSSSVTNMEGMFKGCSSLTSIILGDFDTSSVEDMTGMFYGCSKLTSLDLNIFDTSKVKSMDNMFYECTNLKSLNVNNFETSNVKTTNSMFYSCKSLTTLDLSSFTTSAVTNMGSMFQNCNSLISVNLNNFDTSQVTTMSLIFYGCSSLISLNINSFNTVNATGSHHLFTDIGNDLIFCVDPDKTVEISSELSGYTNNCEDICFTGSNVKILVDNKKCIINCQDDNIYKYEYKNICYEECPINTYVSSDNLFLCQNNPEGYYLDINIYKLCYESCRYCSNAGDENSHNCIECVDGYVFVNDTDKENNCYQKCDFYYYFDSSGNYQCTESNNCPIIYNKLIIEKNKCIDNCSNEDIYQFEFNYQCYKICPNDTHVSSDNIHLCQEKPGNYYLDEDNIYKPCFSTCSSCNRGGDENNHNCNECYGDYAFINDSGHENNCYPKCDKYYFDSSGIYHCNTTIECKEDKPKYIKEENSCIEECKNHNVYKVEYKDVCYSTCPNDTHVSSDNMHLCQEKPENYYLDEDNIYKPCYPTCKSCNIAGDKDNNNCNECISNYIFIKSPQNYNNCYEKCEFYYYFKSDGNYNCTLNEECPEEQRKLIKMKDKCIDECSKDDIYKFEDNNICVKILPNETILVCPMNLPYEKMKECIEICTPQEFLNKECKINNKNNHTVQDNIINSIKTELSKGNLNSTISKVIGGDKIDYIIEDIDSIYQITSSENQKNNEYHNMSSIILGECEEKLKKHYKIGDDESLIIFKVDLMQEGLKIPIIEYEIFSPITLEKLELDCCLETKIEISIPVTINEDYLFKYNSSDEYYNDLCYSYTTENRTDIAIKDRQNEFIDNNMSLCEKNCDYMKYNTSNKKAYCQCKAKGSFSSISEIKSQKYLLMYSFYDLKNALNLEIMKCYKKLFTKKGLLQNIGSYILLSIIFIHILSTFAFIFKGYKHIYNIIQKLVKMEIDNKKDYKKEKKGSNKNNTKTNSIGNIYLTEHKKKNQRNSLKIRSKFSLSKNLNNPVKKTKRNKNKISTKMISENCLLSNNSNTKTEMKYYEKRKSSKKDIMPKSHIFNCNNEPNKRNKIQNDIKLKILNYNDYEMNNLIYKEALELDKRTYFTFYKSLLRQKHLIIFTFYTYNDYNSRIIKISLFLFSFALYNTINALFFNYATLHKIYEDEGSFNFIFQLPQIIYSALISSIISMIIKTLSLSQKNILELKNTTEDPKRKAKNTLSCLKIKFAFFYLLSFLFLLFFWYYLACFCSVYFNTQMHLIKDSLISFGLSLVYPLFINLIPGCFRIPALKSVNKEKKNLYKLSQIIQLI